MKPRIAIIGAGNIGSEVYRKAKDRGWHVDWVADIDGMYKDLTKKKKIGNLKDYKTKLDLVNLGVLTINTFDNGETAFDYIKNFLDRKIPVITSEKGALANYFSELELAVGEGMLGYSATVGGGSRLLKYLKERGSSEIEEIHAVVNGTLNYIFTGLSEGRSLGEVVDETRKLGYTEPGAENPIDIMNKEATGDVPMKASILFNISDLTIERMRAKDVKTHKIGSSELRKLIKESVNRRYIVSITKYDNHEEDVIWGFRHSIGEWNLSAGFKHIQDNPLFKKLIPNGVDNAVLISEGEHGKDGTYVVSGPGAGSGPTSASILRDAEEILFR